MITAIICDDKVSTLWRGKGNEIRITTANLLSDEQCHSLYVTAIAMSVSGKTVAELYKTGEEMGADDENR